MTSHKLHNIVTELAGAFDRSVGNKTVTLRRPWVKQLLDTLGDIVEQVEELEAAEQINIHTRDALIRIFNDAETWLERARQTAYPWPTSVEALAADNAP